MKKIKIKVNNSEIKVLNQHLEILNRSVSPYRHIRVLQSVLIPVSQRVLNKLVTIAPDNLRKTFSVSYHEAHYLEIFLKDIIYQDENQYNRNVILKIRNELDEKLA